MPMPALNQNVIEVHTSVRKPQRDYLMQLAATPGLTETGTLTELLSYAAAAFLTAKPYNDPNWQWIRPEGYYRYVAGERLPNADWVALNPGICDIDIDGETLSSQRIVAALQDVASKHVPKLRSNDTGMNSLLHTLIEWAATDLYPRSKYAPKKRVERPAIKIDTAQVQASGRRRLKG